MKQTITILLIAAVIMLDGCACYDGFGWQPCAGYTHNAHDTYTQSLPVKNKP